MAHSSAKHRRQSTRGGESGPALSEEAIERHIQESFEANYRRLLAEGGAHLLTPHALEQARQQVQHYWKKLREIAVSVTETEVRLQLPNRRTPKGRRFVIEGVVDLVREAERIRMYDIKTHYCDEVRHNVDTYAMQLNVYAYIWRELRGQELHEMGIIAVQLPLSLRRAIADGDLRGIEQELSSWNPLVPIPISRSSIDDIFRDIADTVDRIEDGVFMPPTLDKLRAVVGKDANTQRPVTFATLHCRNCDGRFSCGSYRQYVLDGSGRGRHMDLVRYLDRVSDEGELNEWIDGNIELDLERLFQVVLDDLAPRAGGAARPPTFRDGERRDPWSCASSRRPRNSSSWS